MQRPDANSTADLRAFFAELQRETDRGLPLVGAALIDAKLLETLQSFLRLEKVTDRLLLASNAPLGSLSARTDACFALGLIEDIEYREITIIRKIRNAFAHAKHGLSFQDEVIRGLCASLEPTLPDDSHYPNNDARFRLTISIIQLVLRLYHRSEWVAEERCSSRVWIDPDVTRWRSYADEPPPDGMDVVFIRMEH